MCACVRSAGAANDLFAPIKNPLAYAACDRASVPACVRASAWARRDCVINHHRVVHCVWYTMVNAVTGASPEQQRQQQPPPRAPTIFRAIY